MTDLERLTIVARRAMGFSSVADMALSAGAGTVLELDPEAVVRAVLRAMREPSDAMYEALSAKGKMWRDTNSQDVWQTYIDSILEG